MSKALTSQMNIRIGSELKQRGDTALAQMGYTASEVVRAIWTLASSGGSGMDALKGVLARGMSLERSEHIVATNDATGIEPWELYDHHLAKLGEGYHIVPTQLCDDELLEQETFDRMRQKGML